MKSKILKVMICGFCLVGVIGCQKKEDSSTQNKEEENTKVDFINDNQSYFISIDEKNVLREMLLQI